MDADAKNVVRLFVLPDAVQECQPLGNHGGFSGANLWRVTTTGATYCLRAWPPERPTPDELHWVHHLQDRAARALPFVPQLMRSHSGETIVQQQGRLWELTTWLSGRADFHEHPTLARLRAAFTALAKLHRSWEAGRLMAKPPAVGRRLMRLAEWVRFCDKLMNPAIDVERDPQLLSLARRALEQVRRWLRPARFNLQSSLHPLPTQPCLCDIWHDHVLFQGKEVSGIIDYGSVRQDTVAADLARLIGSLVGDDPAQRQAALEAYELVRPLPAKERALIDVLDWTGIVVGAMNWLRWLWLENRHFEDMDAVITRFSALVVRMEKWKSPGAATPGPLSQ